jgi:hypothetical protein
VTYSLKARNCIELCPPLPAEFVTSSWVGAIVKLVLSALQFGTGVVGQPWPMPAAFSLGCFTPMPGTTAATPLQPKRTNSVRAAA